MVKLDADIKAIARSIIQGNEKRKKRIKNGQASAFDLQAAGVIDNALRGTCGNIESVRVRRQMQEKIYKSIVYNMPYEYIADALCGRRQFYEYRQEFIKRVASAMDMLPEQKGQNMGMGIDLSRFKVVHGDKVFNAIALMEVHMSENAEWDKRDIVLKPKFIDVLAINEDGNIISIYDEAWTFQFIPIVGK